MVLVAEARRSEAKTREHIAMVVDFLLDGRTDDDALATCSPGWRPRNWEPNSGPCPAEDCATKHDHSPHPVTTPRWQSEIDGAIDRWPRYLRIGVPQAINRLPVLDRLIVRGRTSMGMSFRKVGEMVDRDHHTVQRHYGAALEFVEGQVWDAEGQPRY